MKDIQPGWHEPYLNLAYVQGGRDRAGLDCYGLHRLVLEQVVGVADVPIWSLDYDVHESAHIAQLLINGFAQSPWRWFENGERTFDAILFRWGQVPAHVGTVVRPGMMLHIHEGVGARLESYRSPEWNRRLLGFYRHEDLA